MSCKYLVCKHTYQNNRSTVIKHFLLLENAMSFIDDILCQIQVEIQGDSPFASSINLSEIHNLAYGMFVLKYADNDKKCTIYRRHRHKAYFRINYRYEDVALYDLFIVEMPIDNAPIVESIEYDDGLKQIFSSVLGDVCSVSKDAGDLDTTLGDWGLRSVEGFDYEEYKHKKIEDQK